ncbi:MAG TPA: hypothetical protein VHD32_13815 [Candidatus Didemnitutus sp.]|nr:hypothetical protein [Candidatus Didemnitutus sp.]
MNSFAARRCIRHSAREAVAQCPSCHEHFCRECVTEHDGALLCAACLALLTTPAAERKRVAWRKIRDAVYLAFCVLLAWVAFYGVGSILKSIPAPIHEGNVWGTTTH